MPGVLGVYTAADLKGYGPLKCVVPFNNRDGSPMKKPLREALAVGKVRYVGDPVAFVVAETNFGFTGGNNILIRVSPESEDPPAYVLL